MSGSIERVVRIFDLGAGEHPPKPVRYWRTRSPEERLRETLQLHREGNDLFKGGNTAFEYVMQVRHVATP
ncbi:MAG: hypothetical protein QM612_12485 [Thermomonas sp.]|uniref:hypothetical protein n=1 Tax=Thermomonas sp. TaxID=1971895 RepID=UPI0039E5B749